MSDVIIGLGGTGGKVIRALRNRIRQTRGEDSNFYFCLDTMGYGYYLQEIYGDSAQEQILDSNVDTSGNMDPAELNKLIQELIGNDKTAIEQDEYLQFEGLSSNTLGDLLANPYSHDGLYSWLRVKDLSGVFGVSDKVFQFREGAGQYRQIGRIGSMTTAQEIQRRLKAIETRSRPRDSGSRTVHILCSLAGGTGSGNFIDVGVLARSIFSSGRQKNKQGPADSNADNVNLLLLLDGAFGSQDHASGSNADMDVITYAVLRELGRLQSPLLPKSELAFRYPGIGPITLEDQSIFDQVCLMDFQVADSVGESYRRETVYPGMAEMIDLISSPGTGAKVNVSLINLNKKIRFAQARSDETAGDGKVQLSSDAKQAWSQDRFSPFFSTFNSYRVLFPRLAYKQKAQAESVRYFLGQLIPKEERILQKHLDQAYELSHWTAITKMFQSLFGNTDESEFNLPASFSFDEDYQTPAQYFLERNDGQVKYFMHQSLNDLVSLFEGEVTAYNRDHKPEKLFPKATKDHELRENIFKQLDQIRHEEFAVRSLNDMGSRPLRLADNGGVQKVLQRTLSDKKVTVKKEIFESLSNLLRNPDAIDNALWVFRAIRSIYLQALIDYSKQRDGVLQELRKQAQSQANSAKAAFQQVEKNGRPCLELGEDYLKQEGYLFNESFKSLLNTAQIELLQYAQGLISNWIKQMEDMKKQLISENRSNSAYTLAGGVITSVKSQLLEWAKGKNVSLGIQGHLQSPDDLTMGGFEQFLTGDVIRNALSLTNTSWKLGEESETLNLIYENEVIDHNGKAFEQLGGYAKKQIDEVFEGWTFYRYVCEYVCNNDPVELKKVADELANIMNEMKGSIIVNELDKRIHTERYIVCSEPGKEARSDQAPEFIRLFGETLTKLSKSFQPIYTTEAIDEFSLVRMDSGLNEANVGKLSSCQDGYRRYIERNAAILPLAHVLPEEQGMVVREREMHEKVGMGEQRLLPNALGLIFANEHLMDLFLGLYYTGFVFSMGEEQADLKHHYWVYLNVGKIQQLLKGSVDDLFAFIDEIADNPEVHYGDLFDLNIDLADVQSGSISTIRPYKNAPDFFTAMTRFVQRSPNGDNKHPRFNNFPLNLEQVIELNKRFKPFWAKKDAEGPFIRYIEQDLSHWREMADQLETISDDEWIQSSEGNTQVSDFQEELGILINAAPLTKTEAIEYLNQITLFLEKYYHKVKPTGDTKRRGLAGRNRSK